MNVRPQLSLTVLVIFCFLQQWIYGNIANGDLHQNTFIGLAYGPPTKKQKTENNGEAKRAEEALHSNGISIYLVTEIKWVMQSYYTGTACLSREENGDGTSTHFSPFSYRLRSRATCEPLSLFVPKKKTVISREFYDLIQCRCRKKSRNTAAQAKLGTAL